MQNISVNRGPFRVLTPHPRWRWHVYPLRWLLGGCWTLWHLPLRGTLYGIIFFAVGYSWNRALTEGAVASVALATALTGLTLLLAPRLTAGLLPDGAAGRAAVSAENREERQGDLIGLGTLLLMILSVAFNSALAGFALLHSGALPPPEQLFQTVFSFQNMPLTLLLLGLMFIAGMSMQLMAVLPTFLLLKHPKIDLFSAIRSGFSAACLNWRPLAAWSLTSQVLLFTTGNLLPALLVLLAPLIACGSWWACREIFSRGRVAAP